MKLITSFLLRFAVSATLLTLIFRYFLSQSIELHSFLSAILTASLYAISMFLIGWYFGKRDREHMPIFDVGFRFHLTTYLIHNIISELWFVFGFNSANENITSIHFTALIWGCLLFVHYIFFLRTRNQTVNHIHKKDLFD